LEMKRIFALLLALGLLCAALPILAEGDASGETKEDWMAVVKSTAAGSINLRTGPTARSESLGLIRPGTQLKVLKVLEKWTLVDAGGKSGYMYSDYLDFYVDGRPTENPYVAEVVAATGTTTAVVAAASSSSVAGPEITWPKTESTAMYVSTENGKGLNLRARPETGSTLLNTYAVGTAVTVLHRKGDWAYVKVGRRYGFMMLKFLSTEKPKDPDPIGTAVVQHPWGSFVNLRSSRTTEDNSNVIAQLPTGTTVEVYSRDMWYTKVRWSGQTGWIVTKYLNFN